MVELLMILVLVAGVFQVLGTVYYYKSRNAKLWNDHRRWHKHMAMYFLLSIANLWAILLIILTSNS